MVQLKKWNDEQPASLVRRAAAIGFCLLELVPTAEGVTREASCASFRCFVKCGSHAVPLLGALCGLLIAAEATAQEARLEVFPIRPIYVEAAYRQTFAPNGHEVGIQAGFTALRYGDFELNGTYQYFGLLSENERSDLHSVYVNPRWNNFLDILDFPSGRPLNHLLRHLLFGPLENRAVPFVGALIGTVLSGPGVHSPGFSYGGQIGVRFPVAHSVALEVSVGYFVYDAHIHEETGQQRQLLLSTGFAF